MQIVKLTSHSTALISDIYFESTTKPEDILNYLKAEMRNVFVINEPDECTITMELHKQYVSFHLRGEINYVDCYLTPIKLVVFENKIFQLDCATTDIEEVVKE